MVKIDPNTIFAMLKTRGRTPRPTESLYAPPQKNQGSIFRRSLAEGTGFEPADTLRYRQFSKLLV